MVLPTQTVAPVMVGGVSVLTNTNADELNVEVQVTAFSVVVQVATYRVSLVGETGMVTGVGEPSNSALNHLNTSPTPEHPVAVKVTEFPRQIDAPLAVGTVGRFTVIVTLLLAGDRQLVELIVVSHFA